MVSPDPELKAEISQDKLRLLRKQAESRSGSRSHMASRQSHDVTVAPNRRSAVPTFFESESPDALLSGSPAKVTIDQSSWSAEPVSLLQEPPRTAAASNLRDDGVIYSNSSSLQPLPNPQLDLKDVHKNLHSADWKVQFNTLDTVRRLCIHHSDLLRFPLLVKDLIKDISMHIISLRSSLVRNALMCVADFVRHLPKMLDPELPALLPHVLKRASDGNSFLVEQANRTLDAIVEYTPETKLFQQLLLHSNGKLMAIKVPIGNCMLKAIQIHGIQLLPNKEFSKVLKQLAVFIGAAQNELRSVAKECFTLLASLIGIESLKKIVEPLLDSKQFQMVKKV